MRLRSRAAAAATTVILLSAAGAASASASSVSAARWRFSYTSNVQLSGFQSVAAMSARDVWAAGGDFSQLPVHDKALIKRWNGTSWSTMNLPARYKGAELSAVAGSGQSDVWVFGDEGHAASQHMFALRWNGSWSLRGYWHTFSGINGVLVLGPRDVWIFAANGTFQYNGTRWRTFRLPYTLTQASVVSASDIWAVGTDNMTHSPVLARWHNGRWASSTIPGTASSGYTPAFLFNGIFAASDSDLWVVGSQASGRGFAIQLAHGQWTRHDPGTPPLSSVISDGAGGLWATIYQAFSGYAIDHYVGGRWHLVKLPVVKGKATSAVALSRVPKSRTVFAAGIVLWGGLPDTEAAVLKYGR